MMQQLLVRVLTPSDAVVEAIFFRFDPAFCIRVHELSNSFC